MHDQYKGIDFDWLRRCGNAMQRNFGPQGNGLYHARRRGALLALSAADPTGTDDAHLKKRSRTSLSTPSRWENWFDSGAISA